jgi:hypothetical protein
MARFVLMLRPSEPSEAGALIEALDPMVRRLRAEVDRQTPSHLSAKVASERITLPLRWFADVQARLGGPVLELVVTSQEAMGRGAPVTRRRFEEMVAIATETMPHLKPVFRSDRQGPLPRVS